MKQSCAVCKHWIKLQEYIIKYPDTNFITKGICKLKNETYPFDYDCKEFVFFT